MITLHRRIVAASSLLVAAGALVASFASAAAPAAPDPRGPRTTASVTSRDGSALVVLRPAATGETGVARTEYSIDGGAWRPYVAATVTLLDRTAESYARWEHVGPGSIRRLADGTLLTDGGLGMLWFPETDFGDVAFTVHWRDARTDGHRSNGGVIIRFPHPVQHTALSPNRAAFQDCQRGYNYGLLSPVRPEWMAVECGQEIQINDGDKDPQQSGSVYNFQSLAKPGSAPTPIGTWNSYEIRTTGAGTYRVEVIRNGRLINSWVNTPGQPSHRDGDPPSEARQYARGYFGLQNHTDGDVIQYRDIAVRSLRPESAAFAVRGVGKHVIRYRSIDWSGTVEPTQQLDVSVR